MRSKGTVRARSSEAINPLKKSAMVETRRDFYDRGIPLELAWIVATIGSRSSAASSVKVFASRDTRCATCA
jgi:hypothetical protein